jgi:adenylate cyclase
MGKEIERKFLVNAARLPATHLPIKDRIEQFYLSFDPSIRVRIVDETKAKLTIKGPGLLVRDEFEYVIPLEDATGMRDLRKAHTLYKYRHVVDVAGFKWEIDCFTDPFGLWMAEIELPSEDTVFERPSWVQYEVTNDFRYSNTWLAENGRAPVECPYDDLVGLITWQESACVVMGDAPTHNARLRVSHVRRLKSLLCSETPVQHQAAQQAFRSMPGAEQDDILWHILESIYGTKSSSG